MAAVSYRAVCDTALAEVGYQGTSNTSKYSKELDAVKFYNYPKNGAASWCAIFYDWCVFVNNGRDVDKTRAILCEPNVDNCGAGCTQKVQYYKSKGRYYTKSSDATTGDEIFFKKSNGQVYHTGIVVDWGHFDGYGDGFMVVEGNTNGNKVAKKFYGYKDSKIAGFGRPDWYKYEDKTETKPEPKPEPTPTPAPAAPSYKTYTVMVNTALNVRRGPGTNYGVTRTIPARVNGSRPTVKVYETKNGWGRISDNEWVSMNYLK